MASSSLALQLQIPSHKSSLKSASLSSSSKLSNHCFKIRHISATVSDTPAVFVSPLPEKLPIKKILGAYGIPVIGPWKDRLDYFYTQGREEYFRSRIQKYESTVFRADMPPGLFISFNPNVVVLLDGKSFPTLFDLSKVEKRDVFTGPFIPSTELTGGYRILSYLDPSEPGHAKLKQLMFYLLSALRGHVIPEFHNCYTEMIDCHFTREKIQSGLLSIHHVPSHAQLADLFTKALGQTTFRILLSNLNVHNIHLAGGNTVLTI